MKRKIDQGKITTIQSFEREIYLMLMNAVMYNASTHEIHQRTLEMEVDVKNLIETYKSAQKTLRSASVSGEAVGLADIKRSPVKLRSSIRRSKKSESDWDDLHDELASGEHTPLSLTDAELEESDGDKHSGHKTRESSPDIALAPMKRGPRGGRRLTDRTSSTEGTILSPDVLGPPAHRTHDH